MMNCLIVTILVGLIGFHMRAVSAAGEETEKMARLLSTKHVMNQYLAEGKDMIIEYKIYNVGESAATDVKLKEEGFSETDFTIVQGFLDVQWDRIAPKTNVSHAIVMKPLRYGFVNFTAAELSYMPRDDAPERLISYTTAPGKSGIINHKDFERRFSPHVLDWLVFAIMTLPSLGIPYMLWYSSKRKYDSVRPKRN